MALRIVEAARPHYRERNVWPKETSSAGVIGVILARKSKVRRPYASNFVSPVARLSHRN